MKKGILFFLAFVLVVFVVIQSYQSVSVTNGVAQQIEQSKDISLNEFIILYNSGVFEKVVEKDVTELEGFEKLAKTGSVSLMTFNKNIDIAYYNKYHTTKPVNTTLSDLGISFTGDTIIETKFSNTGVVGFFMEHVLPLIIFIVILLLLFKFLGPKGGGFPFNVKAGRLSTKKDISTRFKDIAGMNEVKEELMEIIDFLKNPAKYQEVGARPPKGILLHGVPGSGKTLLAKAVAGEANASFFSVSGSEFMEMLVGMGAAKVRELFSKAKLASPSIIFIDEIDAIGKKRGGGYSGGHQEQEQTLNQILTEMDGFDTDTNVIVIAATNRPDTLDPALLRSGRFDRKIMVGTPTLDERVLIIEYYLIGKKITEDLDINALAKRTSGFVGADLENMVNEAALKIAKDGRKIMNSTDFEYALEKVLMGPEKKIKTMGEDERKIIAYHELGHAVTAYSIPESDPVEKISIVSRGMALGVTWTLPQEDKYLYSKAKFHGEMVKLLGGRAAEEIFFGKDNITTGASNDFQRTTKIARDLFMKYGMDEELGQIQYIDANTEENGGYFRRYSDKTAELADKKIKDLVKTCYDKAITILKTNKDVIHAMAEVLLEKEYIMKDEFEDMMKDIKNASPILDARRKTKKIGETEKDKKETKDTKKNTTIVNNDTKNMHTTIKRKLGQASDTNTEKQKTK